MNRVLVGGESHVLVCREDPDDAGAGTLVVEQRLDVGPMPSFLAFAPSAELIFAAVEEGDELAVIRVVGEGRLALAEKLPCPGGPAHVSTTADGARVVTTSYGSGEVRIFSRTPSGSYALAAEAFAGENAHFAEWSREGDSTLLVACKGADALVSFAFDGRKLSERREHAAPKGSGPRHFVDLGSVVFVACENDVSLAAFERRDGRLEWSGSWPLSTEGRAPGETGADLHVSPEGRTLYASVRGRDSLVSFAVDGARVRPLSELRLPGRVPRNFSLAAHDRVFVAEQETKTVSALVRDDATGRLEVLRQSSVGERAFFVRPWTAR